MCVCDFMCNSVYTPDYVKCMLEASLFSETIRDSEKMISRYFGLSLRLFVELNEIPLPDFSDARKRKTGDRSPYLFKRDPVCFSLSRIFSFLRVNIRQDEVVTK